ncbi:hypothetical protein [Microbacterium sp. C7(2022)]|uniref:hypothetical protein n=1 Tax=Microbacterium sp. C7(2022) TaxID=2992759 RepID=UPI00237A6C51|nr:hypothetical protein [Microbacterium sp. C7(2022)]MDE0547419.1 hypothetical protein [Microbacterium sp. C7(2022)]
MPDDPSSWEVLTGVTIPVIAAVASIALALAALFVAIAANRHAKTALTVSRQIAKEEREERQHDRERELRAKRARVVKSTLKTFREEMLAEPAPQEPNDAFARALVVVSRMRAALVSEGLPLDVDALHKWLFKVTDETIEAVYRPTGECDSDRDRAWRKRRWRVLEVTVGWQLEGWQQTGEIDAELSARQVNEIMTLPEELVASVKAERDMRLKNMRPRDDEAQA